RVRRARLSVVAILRLAVAFAAALAVQRALVAALARIDDAVAADGMRAYGEREDQHEDCGAGDVVAIVHDTPPWMRRDVARTGGVAEAASESWSTPTSHTACAGAHRVASGSCGH